MAMDNEKILSQLTSNIYFYCREHKVKIASFEEQIGVSKGFFSRSYTKTTTGISMFTLLRITQLTGCTVEQLVYTDLCQAARIRSCEHIRVLLDEIEHGQPSSEYELQQQLRGIETALEENDTEALIKAEEALTKTVARMKRGKH